MTQTVIAFVLLYLAIVYAIARGLRVAFQGTDAVIETTPISITLTVTPPPWYMSKLTRTAFRLLYDHSWIVVVITTLVSGSVIVQQSWSILTILFERYAVVDSSQFSIGSGIVAPILPGLNFPLQHVLHLLVSIILCVVVHELGHACSAFSNDVPIPKVGGFWFLFMLGGFVQFNTVSEEYKALSWNRKISLYSSGVLNNLLFFCICSVGIHLVPVIFFPLYSHGNGLALLWASNTSGMQLYAQRHCLIDSVYGQPVYSQHDIHDILDEAQSSGIGLCIDRSLASDFRGSTQQWQSSGVECFRFPGEAAHSCFNVKSQLPAATSFCSTDSDCAPSQACAEPLLEHSRRRIIPFALSCQGTLSPVFLVAQPNVFSHQIGVTAFQPRFLLRFFGVSKSSIPDFFYRVFDLSRTVTLSIAMLNAAPIFAFDSEYVLTQLLLRFFPTASPIPHLRWVLFVGSICLLLNLVYALYITLCAK